MSDVKTWCVYYKDPHTKKIVHMHVDAETEESAAKLYVRWRKCFEGIAYISIDRILPYEEVKPTCRLTLESVLAAEWADKAKQVAEDLIKQSKDIVKSPCTKVCKLIDGMDICSGCYRSTAEIADWGKCNDNGKLSILSMCLARKDLYSPS